MNGLNAAADLLPQTGLHQLRDLFRTGVRADGGHFRLHDLTDLLTADLHKGGQIDVYKRQIVGGMDRVYEIGRIFRNEGMDPKHNPEFTTVEMYQAYADFHTMMDIAEGILAGAAKEINGSYQVEWMGEQIDLTPGWRRLTMVDAVKEYVGVDFGAITDDAEAVAAAKVVGVELADAAEKTWGNALYACFDQKVEEKLIQPTFITMYPVEVSPLTKRSPADPRLTERFELFICHSELANAYSELNDPIDQRQRFEKQVEQRERGDDETEMLDEDFLTAMEYGMPPTGGMGMGLSLIHIWVITIDQGRIINDSVGGYVGGHIHE